jgi:hypothetical protein
MNPDLQTRIDRIKNECNHGNCLAAKSLIVAIEDIERIRDSLAVIPALRAQETLTKIASTWEGKRSNRQREETFIANY